MKMTGHITVGVEDYKELKKEYLKNKAEGKTQFIWRGHDLLVSYAGYLIEYLEMRFKEVGKLK